MRLYADAQPVPPERPARPLDGELDPFDAQPPVPPPEGPASPLDGELDPSLPPFFNPGEAARGYAAGAFVLAGFCFAAIVLTLAPAGPAPEGALSALLTAFLGCVVSAFVLALVAGQTHRSERSFWLALLGGICLGTSALFALWGVSELIRVALELKQSSDAPVVDLTYGAFVVASLVVSAFIVVIGIDLSRIGFNKERARLKKARSACSVAGEPSFEAELRLESGVLSGIALLAWFVPLIAFSVAEVDVAVLAWFALIMLTAAVGAALTLSATGQLEVIKQATSQPWVRLVRVLVAVPPFFAGSLLSIWL